MFCVYLLLAFFLPCAHSILFSMKAHSSFFSVLLSFFFCTSLISFCYLFYFHILFKHVLNHTKFFPLNLIHSSMYIRFYLYIFFTMFCVCFPNCAYFISKCCFLTLLKNRIGWLDDRRGPSLILYDTAPLVCTRGVQHFLSVSHISNSRHLAGPHEKFIF